MLHLMHCSSTYAILSKQRDRIPTQSLRTRQVAAIGHVETPFVKRSGTPRQGMVCPSSKGIVKLGSSAHACLPSGAGRPRGLLAHLDAVRVPREYGHALQSGESRAPSRLWREGRLAGHAGAASSGARRPVAREGRFCGCQESAYTHLGFRFVSRDADLGYKALRPVGRPTKCRAVPDLGLAQRRLERCAVGGSQL